ncbi:MAG: ATP-binding protein [Clostridia bacterium]|nr:ATP-binding protein [Clostridia bacterium]
MGYSRENLKKIKEEFSQKRLEAQKECERRTVELEEKYLDLKKLNALIRETGIRIMETAFSGEKDIEGKIKDIEAEYDANISIRKSFLDACGCPGDYFDVKYECELCSDEGFDDNGKMCICMKRALALATYESSGIGKLISRQSFENFDLGYYKAGEERNNMKLVLESCKDYASTFDSKTSENMLFFGTTGLGKTHLSTSVAKTVIDRGYDVVYETAQKLFDDFEHEKFSHDYNSDRESVTRKYFDCDLLIIDDLGTELSTQFTVSCLYNIINSRINNEKPMMISTNLGQKELRQRYADRITSRLFGEFSVMVFKGEDIRIKKLDEE